MLLGNLRKEPDDENKKLLIWLCLEFIYESVNHEAVNHFPQAYITTLIQKITSQPEVWTTNVILSALKALYDLAKLYPHLAKDNAVSIRSIRVRSPLTIDTGGCPRGCTRIVQLFGASNQETGQRGQVRRRFDRQLLQLHWRVVHARSMAAEATKRSRTS